MPFLSVIHGFLIVITLPSPMERTVSILSSQNFAIVRPSSFSHKAHAGPFSPLLFCSFLIRTLTVSGEMLAGTLSSDPAEPSEGPVGEVLLRSSMLLRDPTGNSTSPASPNPVQP